MLKEILEMFEPLIENSSLTYFDGTFGRGGHAKAILEKSSKVKAVAFDRDLEAVEYAKNEFADWVRENRLTIIHANYCDFKNYKLEPFDFMLLDLGVSSPQLDQGHRGFSFYHEGPLDMRMNQAEDLTAADIIRDYSEDELVNLFREYGEISRPERVVRAIIHDRKTKPFVTTRDLAGLIERVDGWRKKGHHPATQYFLALRMKVNNELELLAQALQELVLGLKPKGRLAVLTFHSLEDRIVKNTFKSLSNFGQPVNKKVIQPDWSEAKENSRARSAKLRVFERSEANNAESFGTSKYN